MAFDKDEYWRRRRAGMSGTPKPNDKGVAYSVHEVQAMQYHKRVEDAVADGHISKEAAIAELIDASKVAVEGMKQLKAPEILIAKVELLILHGSYEQAQKAQSEAQRGPDVSTGA